MLVFLLKCFALLPLPVIHGLGWIAGWGMYFGSSKFARWTRDNLAASGITETDAQFRHLLRRNIVETGKSSLETLAIWFRPEASVLRWVRGRTGWEHVDQALQQHRGIIFLTPHLGCFEVTSLYYAAEHPISVLYRPPRKAWLESYIKQGRSRGQVKLAPTNLHGVRSLLKALKHGEAIGILPDQVPDKGEGVWANFFGRPAYTMTLVERLQRSTDAVVLLAFGERLPWGRGYIIHITPFSEPPEPAALNQAIEHMVRQKPEQYFWSYQRHKVPTGVTPPQC